MSDLSDDAASEDDEAAKRRKLEKSAKNRRGQAGLYIRKTPKTDLGPAKYIDKVCWFFLFFLKKKEIFSSFARRKDLSPTLV